MARPGAAVARWISGARLLVAAGVVASCHGSVPALEPPTAEQVARYQRDGTLERRVATAYGLGNHLASPHLTRWLGRPLRGAAAKHVTFPYYLRPTGSQRLFALLIEFADHRGQNTASEIDSGLFGEGNSSRFPYESVRSFYRRSSYGLLDIGGSTLGWYRTSYPRSSVELTTEGRERLLREAISYHDRQGHDFAQYDNDGDGIIEHFIVIFAGPPDEWTGFWWAMYQPFTNAQYRVDGRRLGSFSFQGEGSVPFAPRVVIHETGHALGLPDLYDYDEPAGVEGEGPPGGAGGLDMMDRNFGDHNCFSKVLLGWITPSVVHQGTSELVLHAADVAPEAALLMHGEPPGDPFGEYFLVQHRRRQGNDADYPADGLLIWHVDARLGADGLFRYNNSSTDHKLVRLMEADGLEQIERGLRADAGDFFRPGDEFGPDTSPCSDRYDGAPTNLVVDGIAARDDAIALRASLGSGCAILCEAEAPATAWPGIPAWFEATAQTANCEGSPSVRWWLDGDPLAGPVVRRTYLSQGLHQWRLSTTLDDASCPREGSILTCGDQRCWQWRGMPSMTGARALHGATVLSDGRVLVVGGYGPPELYDPATTEWRPTGPIAGTFIHARAVPLRDGRVVVVGSSPSDPVNAEIYDPDTDAWSVTGQLAQDRLLHAAVVLADGRVLVVGGLWMDGGGGSSVPVSRVELFDPQTETWSAAGWIDEWVLYHGLTLLGDGRVLLTGYYSTRIYDPAGDSWRLIDPPAYRRYRHASVRLHDGRVMVIGGQFTRRSEFFDPVTETWTSGPAMGEFRLSPTATVLESGQVLVSGGADRGWSVLSSAELYDPLTGTWTPVDSMAEPRYGHEAIPLGGGTVFVTGGTTTPTIPDWNQWVRSFGAELYAVPEPGPNPSAVPLRRRGGGMRRSP